MNHWRQDEIAKISFLLSSKTRFGLSHTGLLAHVLKPASACGTGRHCEPSRSVHLSNWAPLAWPASGQKDWQNRNNSMLGYTLPAQTIWKPTIFPIGTSRVAATTFTDMNQVDIDVVWKRIKACSGEEFRMIRGGTFRYQVRKCHVIPNRTNQEIPKSHFDKALGLLPFEDTLPLQHLRAPSLIYAILMDDRIRMDDW